MRALLAALAVAALAQEGVEEALAKLRAEPEPPARVELVKALNAPPLRGARAYQAIAETAESDLSNVVRLAAIRAIATWPGGEPLERLERYLKNESDVMGRRELLLVLSTEPAHASNPDATRVIANALLEDASPAVRRGAAVALALRGDFAGIAAARKAAASDPDKEVRSVAAKAVAVLERPRAEKARKKAPPPPKSDAVKGRDKCLPPYGWCECGYPIIKTRPKCLTREECVDLFNNHYRRNNLSCNWDAQDVETNQ